MSLLQKLSQTSGTLIYVQILEWIFDLPEFILSQNEKAKALRLLFNEKITFLDLKCHYSVNQGVLYIQANGSKFGIMPEENRSHLKEAVEFYDKLVLLSKYSFGKDQIEENIRFVNYLEVVGLLNQLNINDQRSQYLIDDYIEALLSISKY